MERKANGSDDRGESRVFFGPVWTTLYLMMGLAAFVVRVSQRRAALGTRLVRNLSDIATKPI
jgi:hypothetical protein